MSDSADRKAAKAGIVTRESDDPELSQALSKARSLEVTLAGHEHDQVMRDKEIGILGQLIGGERNAPLTVAALAFVLAMVVFSVIHGCVAVGIVVDARIETLISAADKCLALATLALGYVCGKSSS